MEYATDIRRCSFPPSMWVDCVTKSKLRQRVSQWIVSNTVAGHVWTLEGTRVDAIKPQLDRLVSPMVTACSCRRESYEAMSVDIVSFQLVSLVFRWSRLTLACKAQTFAGSSGTGSHGLLVLASGQPTKMVPTLPGPVLNICCVLLR